MQMRSAKNADYVKHAPDPTNNDKIYLLLLPNSRNW